MNIVARLLFFESKLAICLQWSLEMSDVLIYLFSGNIILVWQCSIICKISMQTQKNMIYFVEI